VKKLFKKVEKLAQCATLSSSPNLQTFSLLLQSLEHIWSKNEVTS